MTMAGKFFWLVACLLVVVFSPGIATAKIQDNPRCGPIVDQLTLENYKETLFAPIRDDRFPDIKNTLPTFDDAARSYPGAARYWIEIWRAWTLRCLMKVKSTLRPALDANVLEARTVVGVLFLAFGDPIGALPAAHTKPEVLLVEAHELLVGLAQAGDLNPENWTA